MILDTIENRSLYGNISPRLKTGLEYLATINTEKFKEGRVDLDGKNLFVLFQSYETELISSRRYENHDRYIDIQYILEGKEIIRYTGATDLAVAEPYNQDNDIRFFDLAPGTDCVMGPGTFAVFFPLDAHAPKIAAAAPAPVKKVVVKVLVD
jgi:biofilm protein TabA